MKTKQKRAKQSLLIRAVAGLALLLIGVVMVAVSILVLDTFTVGVFGVCIGLIGLLLIASTDAWRSVIDGTLFGL